MIFWFNSVVIVMVVVVVMVIMCRTECGAQRPVTIVGRSNLGKGSWH